MSDKFFNSIKIKRQNFKKDFEFLKTETQKYFKKILDAIKSRKFSMMLVKVLNLVTPVLFEVTELVCSKLHSFLRTWDGYGMFTIQELIKTDVDGSPELFQSKLQKS